MPIQVNATARLKATRVTAAPAPPTHEEAVELVKQHGTQKRWSNAGGVTVTEFATHDSDGIIHGLKNAGFKAAGDVYTKGKTSVCVDSANKHVGIASGGAVAVKKALDKMAPKPPKAVKPAPAAPKVNEDELRRQRTKEWRQYHIDRVAREDN